MKKILKQKTIKDELTRLQDKYVFATTDKASNNISVICKEFYIQILLNEVKVSDEDASSNTYKRITHHSTHVDDEISYTTRTTPQTTIKEHEVKCKQWKIDLTEINKCLPCMYWLPKMHKKPSKKRFITASACCSTKKLSCTLTEAFKLIDKYHAHTANKTLHSYGINLYWIVGNSSKVHQMIRKNNEQKNVENVATYDFSTLYTNIPHDKLKTRMVDVISKAYEGSGKTYISVYSTNVSFVNKHKHDTKAYTKDQLIEMMSHLIDNCYVTCGDSLFRQNIGIPMGTDCS